MDVSLLYNKFPFMPLHGLWVPETEGNHPQYLTERMHRHIWEVCLALGGQIDGIGFGYNSYGAGASVNHLHFQLFVEPHHLPVEEGCWQHSGGDQPYPAQCWVSRDLTQAWQFIERLHAQNIAYNLLYRSGVIYIMPRQFQGHYESAPWSLALTWNEMAGYFIAFNRDSFQGLTRYQIREELIQSAVVIEV
jgi:ATP adenylyltransferase/5',5'''-P-1,P-4-tetraphosphate phosphorylase II